MSGLVPRRTFARVDTPAEPPRNVVAKAVERNRLVAAQRAAGGGVLSADTIAHGVSLHHLPRLRSSVEEQRTVNPPVACSTHAAVSMSSLPVQTTDSKSEDAGFDSLAACNDPDEDLDEARPEIDALIARIVWRRRMHGNDTKTLRMLAKLEQLTASLGYRVEGL